MQRHRCVEASRCCRIHRPGPGQKAATARPWPWRLGMAALATASRKHQLHRDCTKARGAAAHSRARAAARSGEYAVPSTRRSPHPAERVAAMHRVRFQAHASHVTVDPPPGGAIRAARGARQRRVKPPSPSGPCAHNQRLWGRRGGFPTRIDAPRGPTGASTAGYSGACPPQGAGVAVTSP